MSKEINPKLFIIRGNNISPKLISQIKKKNIEFKIFEEEISSDIMIDYIGTLDNFFIMGIGNIVGWGEEFINKLKGYRVDVS